MSSSVSSSPSSKSSRPQSQSSIQSQFRKHPLFIIALLGLVIGIPGYILSAQNYAGHYAFLVQNGKPLKLAMARGETITLGLQIEDGISGYWASDQGLSLTLDGVSTPLTVVAPKERTWGDSIKTSTKDTGKYMVQGNVTIPSSIGGPEQRSLSGTLSGSISYPSGGFLFQDKTVNVNVPVQIQLEAQGTMLWSGGRLLFDGFAGLNILCAALLILLGIWNLLRAIFGKRETPETRSGWQIFKDWLWGLGGGVIAGVIVGGVLGGILISASTSGFSSYPGDISILGLCICGLIGLSIWLGILAKMVRSE